MPAPRAATAVPGSGSRSAASWHISSAARSGCRACPAPAARSPSTCRSCTPVRRPARRPGPGAAAEVRAPFQPVVLPAPRAEEVPDDRESSQPGDEVLLIVEDDPHYARVLLGLARDAGFKGLVAMRGADALDARPQAPADRDLARHLPARHARLDGARASSSRTRPRVTSRCRSSPWRRSASTASSAARSRT